jgi:DNA replication protein DnaC
LNTNKPKLAHLTSAQFAEIEQRAKKSGIHPDTCPTCGSVADQYGERENGTYFYESKQNKCDCEHQIMLRKHYLLANIPDQYMRLDWDVDYTGDPAAKDGVKIYLERWSEFKLYGMGLEFASEQLGVGKTFAATTIGKELIKRKEDVFFIPFNQALHAMRYEDRTVLDRMRDTNVLILDEIVPPPNESLQTVMVNHFESIVRDRTNYNGVTILTTNLSERDMEAAYPRTYSLLAAKQMRVVLTGADARRGLIAQKNLELAMNGERKPIT